MFIFSSVGQSKLFPDYVCWVSWSVLEINIEGVQVDFQEISLFFFLFFVTFCASKIFKCFFQASFKSLFLCTWWRSHRLKRYNWIKIMVGETVCGAYYIFFSPHQVNPWILFLWKHSHKSLKCLSLNKPRNSNFTNKLFIWCQYST